MNKKFAVVLSVLAFANLAQAGVVASVKNSASNAKATWTALSTTQKVAVVSTAVSTVAVAALAYKLKVRNTNAVFCSSSFSSSFSASVSS